MPVDEFSTSADAWSEAAEADQEDEKDQALEVRRVRLNSSAIPYAEYDPETSSMQVTFRSGATYTHENVDQGEFDAFINAPSPGRYWHEVFKGR